MRRNRASATEMGVKEASSDCRGRRRGPPRNRTTCLKFQQRVRAVDWVWEQSEHLVPKLGHEIEFGGRNQRRAARRCFLKKVSGRQMKGRFALRSQRTIPAASQVNGSPFPGHKAGGMEPGGIDSHAFIAGRRPQAHSAKLLAWNERSEDRLQRHSLHGLDQRENDPPDCSRQLRPGVEQPRQVCLCCP